MTVLEGKRLETLRPPSRRLYTSVSVSLRKQRAAWAIVSAGVFPRETTSLHRSVTNDGSFNVYAIRERIRLEIGIRASLLYRKINFSVASFNKAQT